MHSPFFFFFFSPVSVPRWVFSQSSANSITGGWLTPPPPPVSHSAQMYRHTHTSKHIHHGAWLDEVYEVSAASASQRTCEMISCSPASWQTLTSRCFLSADAASRSVIRRFLICIPFVRCLNHTNPASPLSWIHSRGSTLFLAQVALETFLSLFSSPLVSATSGESDHNLIRLRWKSDALKCNSREHLETARYFLCICMPACVTAFACVWMTRMKAYMQSDQDTVIQLQSLDVVAELLLVKPPRFIELYSAEPFHLT